MNTERDPATRIVLSWLREDAHENAERMLLSALDEVDTTPQHRSRWPVWRSNPMNTYAKLIAGAAAVLIAAVVGFRFLPAGPTSGGRTAGPSPSPLLLAKGHFLSHGGTFDLDATRQGSIVTGLMTVDDETLKFTVDLECTATTSGGLIVIGGTVTASTHSLAPKGSRAAIVLKPGSPVQAYPHFEAPDPPAPTCAGFLATVTDAGGAGYLEPISGTLQLGPAAERSSESAHDDGVGELEPTFPDATWAPGLPETFTSEMHGISFRYPAGWVVRRATKPWTDEPLTADSAVVDAIVDPQDPSSFIAVASQPRSMHAASWGGPPMDGRNGGVCGGGGGGRFDVDGAKAFDWQCDRGGAVAIWTDTRGYIVIAEGPDPVGRALFNAVVESVDLRPQEAVDAQPSSHAP